MKFIWSKFHSQNSIRCGSEHISREKTSKTNMWWSKALHSFHASYRSFQKKLKVLQTLKCDYCNKVVIGVLLQNEWFHSIFLFHFHKSCGAVRGSKSGIIFSLLWICDMIKLQFMVLQLNFMRLSLFAPFFACYLIKSGCVHQMQSSNRFAGNLKDAVYLKICLAFYLFLWKVMHIKYS